MFLVVESHPWVSLLTTSQQPFSLSRDPLSNRLLRPRQQPQLPGLSNIFTRLQVVVLQVNHLLRLSQDVADTVHTCLFLLHEDGKLVLTEDRWALVGLSSW